MDKFGVRIFIDQFRIRVIALRASRGQIAHRHHFFVACNRLFL
jgi:hypothetical protein